ncbi:exodeoxyribonuclease VII small subunit [Streptomyces sp. NPDC050560]|uniref:exodeoxyribonuclease VII small subunit n=1 Tax=Streptomyces sp. NPDC050560 TaxID=3365630 RepID=UPI003789CF32
MSEGVGTDGAALGYEQARDELIDVVRRLETGGTSLEESLALWERGEELARVCRRWLDGARARLDRALAEGDAEDDGEDDGSRGEGRGGGDGDEAEGGPGGGEEAE